MQQRQAHDPDTPVDAYLERISLKTGKLFEAACLLGSRDARLGEFGLALGVAFQIADDILDCVGDTIETGKIPGADLREGVPTLPLLIAAREDDVVRRALAGGPLEGALVRVAETSALRSPGPWPSTTLGRRESSCGTSRIWRRSRTSSSIENGELMAVAELEHAGADPREGRGRGAARLRGRARAPRVGRRARARRARGHRASPARRDGRGLLRPEPVREPDERLPREVQVLRVRGDPQAAARVHVHDGGAGRGRAAPARGRPGSPRSTWSTARTRTSTSASTATRPPRSTRRCRTSTSSSTRPRRSTT